VDCTANASATERAVADARFVRLNFMAKLHSGGSDGYRVADGHPSKRYRPVDARAGQPAYERSCMYSG
jgi:hypothetical protein